MRLTELISFVRQIQRRPHLNGRDEPLDDESNAGRIQRGPLPDWVSEATSAERLRDGTGLILQVEEEVPIEALPPDVRQPNPSTDVLAYYKPFHMYAADWGIYLRASGLLRVASILKGSILKSGDTFIDHARILLFKHEFLHFEAEVACARAEVITQYRLYDGYFNDRFAAAHEEALANAIAFRVLPASPTFMRDRANDWMRHQGPGYSDFDKWLTPSKFVNGCRRATHHMLKLIGTSWTTRPEPAEFLFDAMGRFKPPSYFIRDVSLAGILKPFPKAHGMRVAVHTRDHPPPHIHIEVPPGSPYTRYEWPLLRPLKGDRELPSAMRDNLDAYLADYATEIETRVRAVYPSSASLGAR